MLNHTPSRAALVLALCCAPVFGQIPLEQLDLTKIRALAPPMGYPAQAAKSVAGKPMSINGKSYAHGVGTFSGSRMEIDLRGGAERFTALAGVDDAQTAMPKALPGSDLPNGLQKHPGLGTVQVWLDGKLAQDTGLLHRGAAPKKIDVDLRGAHRMILVITDGGRWPYNNPVDLADAAITMKSGDAAKPVALTIAPERAPEIASGDEPKPAIHGPKVVGGSPGKPFLYKIPATGQGTLTYSARNLPSGLTVDAKTGIISGTLGSGGKVELQVKSARGQDTRELTIVAGDRKLALTPPLGWNSWNVWARAVDAQKIREAADAMVKSGLAAHGYQYINIDDAWMDKRDANGEILPNDRFPDMKGLADYVHKLGLKFGIYSSPGPLTCQRLPGSYQHEAQDARTYAKWGVDFLKYDRCSYGTLVKDQGSRAEEMKPYQVMGDALKSLPRDVVFSLCQYGRGDVWQWGPEVGGQLWRTAGDIRDSWESLVINGFSQNNIAKWANPGHWNDPDMLVLGDVGWGVELHASRLTPNEQLTHVTLWSLLASPLLLGCDLAKLDKFTLNLLTNDEVLDVNQDPLGKQAHRVAQDGLLEVWAKPMSDGSMAVGLFNRGIADAKVTSRFADLGISGKRKVRDLWRRKDLGSFDGSFETVVPSHGAVLVKM